MKALKPASPTPRVRRSPANQIAMNVIIAGESGIGKSSLINLIADQQLASTSNDSDACTIAPESYKICIDGRDFVIWDTPGCNDLKASSASYPTLMHTLIRRLKQENVDLLVYCLSGSRAKTALVKTYQTIRGLIPQSTPMVAVVTQLERYKGRMDDWWSRNEQELAKLGMSFADHACITGLRERDGVTPSFLERVADSRAVLRSLICRACPPQRATPKFATFSLPPLVELEESE
ncbi:hypothetical protein ID866_2703, partial [Astraeus odoratus]